MLILECPYCGVMADETDLHGDGEAHLKRFGPGSSDDDFEGYLFMRKNPKGVHFERWRHASGCGKFFSCGPQHDDLGSLRHISRANA